METKPVLDYIKNNKWFIGTRGEESLLFFSIKFLGRKKFGKEVYGMDFVESLLLPKDQDNLVRAFNSTQAKAYHAYSEEKIKERPEIILDYLEKETALWPEMEMKCQSLAKSIEDNDLEQGANIFKELVALYEKHGLYFFIIFSLGLKLTEFSQEGKFLSENIESTIKRHDEWRNGHTFSEGEDKLGEGLYHFLDFFLKQKGFGLKTLDLMTYMTEEEILDLLDNKLTEEDLSSIIAKIKNGYLFVGTDNPETYGVYLDQALINEVSDFLLPKEEVSGEKVSLSGQVAFAVTEVVRGEIILVKDYRELKDLEAGAIAGKILVAIQTRPQYLPYMNDVKAIITDEGGITCHAAIVARERKIPCLVGVKNATKILKNGDLVEVDTKQGIIKIV